jgi:hypothetical protein
MLVVANVARQVIFRLSFYANNCWAISTPIRWSLGISAKARSSVKRRAGPARDHA